MNRMTMRNEGNAARWLATVIGIVTLVLIIVILIYGPFTGATFLLCLGVGLQVCFDAYGKKMLSRARTYAATDFKIFKVQILDPEDKVQYVIGFNESDVLHQINTLEGFLIDGPIRSMNRVNGLIFEQPEESDAR